MKLRLFLVLLSLSATCVAQVDSAYIGFYEQKLSLKAYASQDFLFMVQGMKDEDGTAYMPNNPVSIGLGGSINNTVLSFGYGYGFDFMRDKKMGKTESLDFQLHNYGRKFTFDVYLQKYKGFYIDNDDSGAEVVICPDLRIEKYGVNGQYVLNNKKFSYKAAFDQSEKQLQSAGSILIGSGVYVSKIESDSSFSHNDSNILRNFQFGISGGYAYTWVLNTKWHINTSLTVGINFGSEKFSTFGRQKIEVYPTIFPRISAGYNRENWSLAISYVSNVLFPSVSENSTVSLFSGSGRITYVHRIQSVPILNTFIK